MTTLEAAKLTDLAGALAAAGYRVVAPVLDDGVLRLAEWTEGIDIRTDGVPVNSVKDVLLPRSEVIGRATLDGDAFTLEDVTPEAPKTALLCVRPCDAAALRILDAVFNWDYDDAFYNARREATTVVSLACTAADDQCFCTSVGGAPDATTGADAILRPADGGTRLAFLPLTDKGRAVAEAAGSLLAEADAALDPAADVPRLFDPAGVATWCADNFAAELWRQVSLGCLGCGACAYACPTCHCFDIQDESSRTDSVRLRNWDSCGFGLFTEHASGHNPRPNQTARWRQRVMHKFSYFPERFDMVACTGCGRCARLCPAGVAISEVCREIERAAKGAPEPSGTGGTAL